MPGLFPLLHLVTEDETGSEKRCVLRRVTQPASSRAWTQTGVRLAVLLYFLAQAGPWPGPDQQIATQHQANSGRPISSPHFLHASLTFSQRKGPEHLVRWMTDTPTLMMPVAGGNAGLSLWHKGVA